MVIYKFILKTCRQKYIKKSYKATQYSVIIMQ